MLLIVMIFESKLPIFLNFFSNILVSEKGFKVDLRDAIYQPVDAPQDLECGNGYMHAGGAMWLSRAGNAP